MDQMIAGIIAGGLALTAGGGIRIVAEGWPQAAIIAVCVGAAFGLGSWSAGRRVAAVVAVVQSFCGEIAAYYAARQDGEITDEEAREIAASVGRFMADLEALGELVCREAPR